jgi:hypothetical protein
MLEQLSNQIAVLKVELVVIANLAFAVAYYFSLD